MAYKLNRAQRRKIGMKATSDMLKARERSVQRKQWGFGFILTNCMLSITFYRWVWTPWDRRLK